MSYIVRFVNQNTEISVEGGTLAQACDKAGYPLNLVCGGKGTCGKCKITVKRDGALQQVLACREEVTQDEEVYLEEKDYTHEGSVLTRSNLSGVGFRPSVKKVYRTKEDLMPEHCGSFLKCVTIPVMQKFAALSVEYDFEGCTFVYYEDEIIDVQEGDTTDICYGAAVDIGTTTVVCYIYDLVHNRLVKTKSGLNKQIVHGADVISRNVFAQESPENLRELQRLIQDTINEMLDEAMQEEPAMRGNIYHMVICGNSTMQHLFYGLNPANLGVSPFANITAEPVVSNGKEAQMHCAPEGVVEFLPLLGGFVGADTASVLLTLEEDDKKYIMVDLGTNGEIGVGNHNGFLISSTACGPALEGGNIACGMRGTVGAIEKISIEGDEVKLKVIGNASPQGLCGSAIIDAVAELRKVGLIDNAGTLLSAEEYEKTHPGSGLCKRLREVEQYNLAFYFTDVTDAAVADKADEPDASDVAGKADGPGEGGATGKADRPDEGGAADKTGAKPVYLCQQDIRQIQLAKSSIYSGCMTLLTEYGITPDDVDALVLAGAFGNYIDIDNALSIGLLPPVAREKIISIGNGAGKGVQSLLLDSGCRRKLQNIPAKSTHIELADNPNFMELYIMNMNFQ